MPWMFVVLTVPQKWQSDLKLWAFFFFSQGGRLSKTKEDNARTKLWGLKFTLLFTTRNHYWLVSVTAWALCKRLAYTGVTLSHRHEIYHTPWHQKSSPCYRNNKWTSEQQGIMTQPATTATALWSTNSVLKPSLKLTSWHCTTYFLFD